MNFSDTLWEDKEVLVLNSYSPDNVWTDSVVDGIYDGFKNTPYNINYQVEFMYSKRNYSEAYFKSFLDHFNIKYNNKTFDLVITTDDNAYEFVLANRDEIAGSAPVIFTGINNLNVIQVPKNTTGIYEKVNAKDNLDLIETIHGKGTKIVLFSDYSQTSVRVVEMIKEAQKNDKTTLDIEYFLTDDAEEILKKSSELSDEVVLFVLFNRDSNGRYYTYNEGLRLVTQVTNVPIYSFWSFYMDYGVIGGMITDGYLLGLEAGKYGDLILNGSIPDNLPIIEGQNQYVFDYKELIKHNIPDSSLPENHKLINGGNEALNTYFIIIPVLGIAFIILLSSILAYTNLAQKNKNLHEELADIKDDCDNRLENQKNKYQIKINELLNHEEKLIQINEFLEEALQDKEE